MFNGKPNRAARRAGAFVLACGLAGWLGLAVLGAGCTATGKNAIPASADRVSSGEGPIDYRAQRDGTIWVYDATSKKMVYTGPVRDGDRVRVNTEGNQILVGGSPVSERSLAGDHRYEIYFRRPQ